MLLSWQIFGCLPLIKKIKGDSKIYARYIDDILLIIKKLELENKTREINKLHNNLFFTTEEEVNGEISFLDMKLTHKSDGNIETEWFRKETDTGLTLNYHALAPTKYKRSLVINLIHRIYNATSTWKKFDKGICEAREILDYNQYPSNWYENIINQTLEKLLHPKPKENKDIYEKKMVFINYRGRITDHFVRKLIQTTAPIKPILTIRKLKSALPSLKPKIDKEISSNLVYEYSCTNCDSTYTGMTCRHLKKRISEHNSEGEPKTQIKLHLENCIGSTANTGNFKILKRTQKDIFHLACYEALFIRERSPDLNKKDEFRSRTLRIKI